MGLILPRLLLPYSDETDDDDDDAFPTSSNSTKYPITFSTFIIILILALCCLVSIIILWCNNLILCTGRGIDFSLCFLFCSLSFLHSVSVGQFYTIRQHHIYLCGMILCAVHRCAVPFTAFGIKISCRSMFEMMTRIVKIVPDEKNELSPEPSSTNINISK